MGRLRLFAVVFAVFGLLQSFGKTEDWALRIAGRSMWFSTAESSPGKMLVLYSSPWEADVSRDGSGKVTLTYSYSHPNLAGTHPAPMKSEGEGNAEDGVVQGMGGEAAR